MANIKISELNPLLTVEDADVLPIVDNGVTKKVTAAILQSYTQGNSVLLTGAQTVAGIKTFTSQIASSVATGTAPFSVASTTKVTNLNADLLDGLSSADFQAPLSGTGIVKSTSGTISYLTDNSTNWNTAYNDKINSAAVTGSGTNTLTLTQQDAGTITATWVNGTLIREVRNSTGATLTKGTIVYISGATGNKPTVSKAIATGDSTSAQTFGFIQTDIANNANGYVVAFGDLTGIDTSAFTEGDQLYLSSTTAGEFTATKQYAPAHLVYVGIVTRSHPTLGQIEVNIQNGYEMDELHNVSAQNPSNGDILQFVTSTGLWTKVAGTTSNISEGTNLYFTNARSRSSFSESVTGLDYNSTTGVLSTTSGYGIPTTASQTTWDTAYNDSIVSAAVTGTTTKTLTLNQQDGGSVTASWTDDNTDAVSSVFGRTGAVVAASGDYTTTQVTEGTNLYFTDARARAAISLTTTGTSGAATYTGGVLNIPQYQSVLTNPITGTGTTNYLPKFTGASALGNSTIQDNGSLVTIGGELKVVTADANLNLQGTSKSYVLQVVDSNNKFRIFDNTANVERFSIATGGAANFSSSVTAADDIISTNGTISSILAYSGTYGGVIGTTSNHNANIYTNGTPKLTITPAGLTGIGTTSPASLLHASKTYSAPTGGIDSNIQILASNTSGASGLGMLASNSSVSFLHFGDTDSANIGQIAYTHANDNMLFVANGAERMRIASDGNVGIGSTNPADKLTIVGSGSYTGVSIDTANSTGGAYLAIKQNGVSSGFFGGSGAALGDTSSDLALYAETSKGIRFYTNGSASERMRIFSDGNIAINSASNAGYKLDVNGTARVSGAATFSSSVTAGGNLLINNTSVSKKGYKFQSPSSNWSPQESGIYFSPADGVNAATTFSVELWDGIGGTTNALSIAPSGAATFSGAIAINNNVNVAVAVASTHKVTMVIEGVTYYLLASNV